MLVFNELRIDNDGVLIVDASVLDTTIDSGNTVSINHIYIGYGTNQYPLSDYIDYIDNPAIFDRIDMVGNAIRGFRLTLNLRPDNDKKLIYANVTVDTGVLDVPCTLNTSIEGYAYDKCILLNKVLNYVKSTGESCDNIQDYANYIVQVDGLELAVESGNFSLANLYWNKFFANSACCSNSITRQTGCGCRH